MVVITGILLEMLATLSYISAMWPLVEFSDRFLEQSLEEAARYASLLISLACGY